MGIIYPVFFFGAFLTAVVIYWHRRTTSQVMAISPNGTALTWEKDPGIRKVTGIGLFLKPDTSADVSRIENLTNEIEGIQSGLFVPEGSTLGKL